MSNKESNLMLAIGLAAAAIAAVSGIAYHFTGNTEVWYALFLGIITAGSFLVPWTLAFAFATGKEMAEFIKTGIAVKAGLAFWLVVAGALLANSALESAGLILDGDPSWLGFGWIFLAASVDCLFVGIIDGFCCNAFDSDFDPEQDFETKSD